MNTRLLFTSDIHGAEKVFMKFVNAAKLYKADVIILGGDITGKVIIPIVEQGIGNYVTEYKGVVQKIHGETELSALMKNIRYSGWYPYLISQVEYDRIWNDRTKMDVIFSEIMVAGIQRWVQIAEERLKGTSVKCYISPGNDDRYDIDGVLSGSEVVINPEGKIVKIDDAHEMMTLGYTNMTPWKAPRDIEDEELGRKIEKLASEVSDMKNCIFNLHCPPYDSNLDTAPLLHPDLRPVLSAGSVVNVPVGSKAVRTAIETHQPMLGLHGHIHEAKGASKIGRTLCINPGSEYSEGVLAGAVVDLNENGVKGYVLTSG